MKVLSVTPYPPKTDGIAVHTERLLASMRERADVEVLTTRLPEGPSGELGVHRVLSANPLTLFRAVRVLRSTSPDVVHIQYALPAQGLAVIYAFVAAVWVRRSQPLKLVITSHEVRRELDVLHWIGALIFFALGRGADVMVVHTEESRNLLVERCRVASSKVVITPLGIDAEPRPEPTQLAETRDRYSEAGRELVVFFGWIHPDKGIEDLIEAIARLADRGTDLDAVDVLICGAVRPRVGMFRYFGKKDYEYEAHLHELVRQHRLHGSVHFKGFVPDADVLSLLTLARVVVIPYRNTTQSAVLNHAVAAGAPMIASDLPGLRESVERGGGLLVPPCDPSALADALQTVLCDDALVDELRYRQQSLLEAIAFDRVVDQLLAIYGFDAGIRRPVAVGGRS